MSKESDPNYEIQVINLQRSELDSLININYRFKDDLKLVKSTHSNEGLYSVNFSIDFILSEISTSSWEATKSSGILNEFKHWQIEPIVNVYGWLEKDFGVNETDFYLTLQNNPDEFLDMTSIYNSLYKLESIYKMKLNVLEERLPEFLEFLDEQIGE